VRFVTFLLPGSDDPDGEGVEAEESGVSVGGVHLPKGRGSCGGGGAGAVPFPPPKK